jgi:hypothetical protein
VGRARARRTFSPWLSGGASSRHSISRAGKHSASPGQSARRWRSIVYSLIRSDRHERRDVRNTTSRYGVDPWPGPQIVKALVTLCTAQHATNRRLVRRDDCAKQSRPVHPHRSPPRPLGARLCGTARVDLAIACPGHPVWHDPCVTRPDVPRPGSRPTRSPVHCRPPSRPPAVKRVLARVPPQSIVPDGCGSTRASFARARAGASRSRCHVCDLRGVL